MGYLITIEGADGTGKSTVMAAIREYFADRGVEIVASREPGGVPISEEIRSILLRNEFTEMDARTEALLFAAARRQHFVEKMLPVLNDNRVMVLDRFLDSSIAYQGFARGIGAAEIEKINDFALEGFRPDLTILLDMDVDQALARIARNPEREVNKLDLEKRDFHLKVREGYLKIASMPSNFSRIRIVDASLSPDAVAAQVVKILDEKVDFSLLSGENSGMR
ncbi:MAG: dTMP kinase [Bacillota bacterium]|nr:dTMP kinase [Bacillota bacterium]